MIQFITILVKDIQKKAENFKGIPRLEQLQRDILRPLICKFTEGIGSKYKYTGQRFWSEEAIGFYAINDRKLFVSQKDEEGKSHRKMQVQHEHVFEVVELSNEIISSQAVEKTINKITSCVVTKKEHEELTKQTSSGWLRYKDANLKVIDFGDNNKNLTSQDFLELAKKFS
jgi:hypothetical protein